MIEIYPVKFEAFDTETHDSIFRVQAFDEACATVTISSVVTVESWDEIHARVRECLVAMKLTSTTTTDKEGSTND